MTFLTILQQRKFSFIYILDNKTAFMAGVWERNILFSNLDVSCLIVP